MATEEEKCNELKTMRVGSAKDDTKFEEALAAWERDMETIFEANREAEQLSAEDLAMRVYGGGREMKEPNSKQQIVDKAWKRFYAHVNASHGGSYTAESIRMCRDCAGYVRSINDAYCEALGVRSRA